MPTLTPSRADDLLAGEVAAAWRAYLETIRSAPEATYDEVEPWAWSRLRVELRVLARRQRRLAGGSV